MKKLILFAVFVLLALQSWAADRYFVGGSGNYSDTAHWSATSGGAGGETKPTSSDNVYFDLHSNEPTDAAYTVTIDEASACNNISVAVAGTTGTPTFVRTFALSISGTVTRTAGIPWVLFWFGGSGNYVADYATHWSNNSGNSPACAASAAPTTTDDVVFDANSSANSYSVTVDSGANCRDMTWANPASGSPTLAGSSGIDIYGSLALVSGMGFTFTGGITFRATSGTKTIASDTVALSCGVTLNGSGGTFQLADNLSIAVGIGKSAGTFDPNGKLVTATGTGFTVNTAITFYNFTRTGSVSKTATLTLYGGITVTNALVINGNSAVNRVLVASDTIGTALG